MIMEYYSIIFSGVPWVCAVFAFSIISDRVEDGDDEASMGSEFRIAQMTDGRVVLILNVRFEYIREQIADDVFRSQET